MHVNYFNDKLQVDFIKKRKLLYFICTKCAPYLKEHRCKFKIEKQTYSKS